jgi:hypothetical protein
LAIAAYTLQALDHGSGWRLTIPPEEPQVTLDVTGIRRDRDVVRATLSVQALVPPPPALLYRDTVNLTSSARRALLLRTLGGKGVQVPESALLALEAACRRPSPRTADAPPDGSGTVVPPRTLGELEADFRRWLLIADPALLPVLTGAILAHRLGGEAVWLQLVAPPGGTKTELLRALHGCPGCYPLSELTPKTFASGLEVPGGHDPSLLCRLTDEVLVLKDFTTILEMRREDRQAILAQLREIYDGRYDKTFGTGRELHWRGRLGFVAGVTPIIDKHQGAMAVLGERFALFRTILPDRTKLARRALESHGHEVQMREELGTVMRSFLAARGCLLPSVTESVLDRLATVADFITRARSGVQRDGYKRELEYAPEPEAPTRFAKVLLALTSGIAVAYDHPAITTRDLSLGLRVALDCLPLVRHRVIAALVQHAILEEGERLSTSAIAGAAQFSSQAIRRTLEDLQALNVVRCHKAGSGKADEWTLENTWKHIFQGLDEDALRGRDGGGDGSGAGDDIEEELL